MKILVTGGAGFIGSNFVRYYLSAYPQDSVINLDLLTYAGNLENLTDVQSSPNYQFVRGDICDVKVVTNVLKEDVEGVIHFAAESHVDRSIASAEEFIRTNVLGTFTLIEAARRQRIPRFLHVSTDEVYGSLEPGEWSNETSSLRPNSPYAASKAASDLLVRSYWKTFGFPAIITHSSNNYGPYQFPEKLIPLMITNALEGKKLPVYGDGLNERDWIYVEDHCRALDRVFRSGRTGEVYDIGFGAPLANLEVVRALLGSLGKSEDLIEFVADRPGHDRRYALNITKIIQELGWRPRVTFQEGLKRTVQWYLTHPEWIKKTKGGEYRADYEKFYENRHTTLSQL